MEEHDITGETFAKICYGIAWFGVIWAAVLWVIS
jgi:hypothetical protein